MIRVALGHYPKECQQLGAVPALVRRYKSSSLEDYAEDPRVEVPVDHKASSSSSSMTNRQYAFDENGDVLAELVDFPAVDRNSKLYNMETKPVLLNSKEHAIGYLSKILNARVYEAAIETDLQHARNLSAVSLFLFVVFICHGMQIITCRATFRLCVAVCVCVVSNLFCIPPPVPVGPSHYATSI